MPGRVPRVGTEVCEAGGTDNCFETGRFTEVDLLANYNYQNGVIKPNMVGVTRKIKDVFGRQTGYPYGVSGNKTDF
jgi:hypothetical protein